MMSGQLSASTSLRSSISDSLASYQQQSQLRSRCWKHFKESEDVSIELRRSTARLSDSEAEHSAAVSWLQGLSMTLGIVPLNRVELPQWSEVMSSLARVNVTQTQTLLSLTSDLPSGLQPSWLMSVKRLLRSSTYITVDWATYAMSC